MISLKNRLFGLLAAGIVPAQRAIRDSEVGLSARDAESLRLARMARRGLIALARSKSLDPHRVRAAIVNANRHFATVPSGHALAINQICKSVGPVLAGKE